MSSYKQIQTLFFVLTVACGLELPNTKRNLNESELDHIIRIPQSHAQDNELLVQELNSFTNKSDLSTSDDEIDNINNNNNESERQVTRKSMLNTKLGDDRILSILAEALHVIKTTKCYKDLNYTIDAMRKQKPWAIASKCIHFKKIIKKNKINDIFTQH